MKKYFYECKKLFASILCIAIFLTTIFGNLLYIKAVVWQDVDGVIYETIADSKPVKIFNSLSEYLM